MRVLTANFCPQCGAALERRVMFGRERPVCPACGYVVFFDPKVAVVVFITDGEQVLLVQRRHDPGKDKWALPAGFVEPDEPPETAAIREVEEETGLRVAIDDLILLLHRPDEDGLADLVIAYRAHITGGALYAGDDAVDVQWFSADNLPDIALVTTKRLIEQWRISLK